MTDKKAYKLFENHCLLLKDNNYDSFFLWKEQAVVYVKRFFGESSQEYKSLNEYVFPEIDNKIKEDKIRKLIFIRHVLTKKSDLILKTIKEFGIHREYHNMLCRLSNKELIGYAIAIGSGILIFGAYLGKLAVTLNFPLPF